ncbi:MAG: hypothetical protein NZM11_08420 [Anaerolineales bacterium]|nr:hypothetical protein [Anaerolineales bacterium]
MAIEIDDEQARFGPDFSPQLINLQSPFAFSRRQPHQLHLTADGPRYLIPRLVGRSHAKHMISQTQQAVHGDQNELFVRGYDDTRRRDCATEPSDLGVQGRVARQLGVAQAQLVPQLPALKSGRRQQFG